MIDEHNCYGATDIGRKRESNQDSFLIARLSKSMLVGSNSLDITPQTRLFGGVCGWLMLVADGMGGHAGGERASVLAVHYLIERLLNNIHWFFQLNREAELEFIDSLKKLLRDTHHEIQSEGRRDATVSGMGTTLTMTYLVWPSLYVVHAGDSRCYLIRDGRAELLTTDHTMARRLVEAGGMNPEDEATSRWSNVLWNVLGGKSQEEIKAEVRQIDLRRGDKIMLCSDGLHRYLTKDRIVDILDRSPTCDSACEEFIRLANERGGDDNITVVVAHVPPEPNFDPLAPTAAMPVVVDKGLTDTDEFDSSPNGN
jgi:serine/threonine protein phosphatase PrpC